MGKAHDEFGGWSDPECEYLELLVGEPIAPPDVPTGWRAWARRWRVPVAVVLLLFATAGVGRWAHHEPALHWRMATISGRPSLGSRAVVGRVNVKPGQWLVTDSTSRARLELSGDTRVDVGPNSALQIVATETGEHRLALSRGAVTAEAPLAPRALMIDTPSAIAVGDSCSYRLSVNDRGVSYIEVDAGIVGFEADGIESLVPGGANCLSRPGHGPGVPYWWDASPDLREALAQFDDHPTPERLRAALLPLRTRDALSAWHLLQRAPAAERLGAYASLARLIDVPPGITRSGIAHGSAEMMDALWDALGLTAHGWRRSQWGQQGS